ncbi:MAG: hypothetical protein ONB05_07530 [candidate division KSB1 bacterium]|nr:hypothetical protein [candidate division KSB1 bacterium]
MKVFKLRHLFFSFLMGFILACVLLLFYKNIKRSIDIFLHYKTVFFLTTDNNLDQSSIQIDTPILMEGLKIGFVNVIEFDEQNNLNLKGVVKKDIRLPQKAYAVYDKRWIGGGSIVLKDYKIEEGDALKSEPVTIPLLSEKEYQEKVEPKEGVIDRLKSMIEGMKK